MSSTFFRLFVVSTPWMLNFLLLWAALGISISKGNSVEVSRAKIQWSVLHHSRGQKLD